MSYMNFMKYVRSMNVNIVSFARTLTYRRHRPRKWSKVKLSTGTSQCSVSLVVVPEPAGTKIR